MRDFAFAWSLMWALSYIAVAVIAPGISGDVVYGTILYLAMAGAIIGSLAMLEISKHKTTKLLAKILLFVLALIEVFSGIASWSGIAIWNIPFASKEPFQVSMAFADLISAVFMLYLILSPE